MSGVCVCVCMCVRVCVCVCVVEHVCVPCTCMHDCNVCLILSLHKEVTVITLLQCRYISLSLSKVYTYTAPS